VAIGACRVALWLITRRPESSEPDPLEDSQDPNRVLNDDLLQHPAPVQHPAEMLQHPTENANFTRENDEKTIG
jgi:hypothetical protein